MFEVKFGTKDAVQFREKWTEGDFSMDLSLAVRIMGICEVSEYNADRYENESVVDVFIKSNCSDIFAKCLRGNWPSGTPIVRNEFNGLEKYFDEELMNVGIKAYTKIVSTRLTPESEDTYRKSMEEMFRAEDGSRWDHMPVPVDNPMLSPDELRERDENTTTGMLDSSLDDYFLE